MLATLATYAALDVRGVGAALLKVLTARSCQGGVQRCRPLLVGLGEPPHLIRSHAKIMQYLSERHAAVDRVQKLAAQLDR